MLRLLTWLVGIAWLLPTAGNADNVPAQGKLLVGREESLAPRGKVLAHGFCFVV